MILRRQRTFPTCLILLICLLEHTTRPPRVNGKSPRAKRRLATHPRTEHTDRSLAVTRTDRIVMTQTSMKLDPLCENARSLKQIDNVHYVQDVEH
jgi:hypothetical protein